MSKLSLIHIGPHLSYNPALTEKARTLRRSMTLPEQKIWFQFLKRQPYRFKRQKVINNYIVDFYYASLKLVIEIDGDSHFEDQAKLYDERRTQELEKYGIRVIRFTNLEVMRQFDPP